MSDEMGAPAGLAGVLKIAGGLVVFLLAVLGVLVVTDLVSMTVFGELAQKIFLVTCIIALAAVALGLLMRSSGK